MNSISRLQTVQAPTPNWRHVYLELSGKSGREDFGTEAAKALERLDATSQAQVRSAIELARPLWGPNASYTEVIETGPWARDGDWLFDQSGLQAPCHIQDLEQRKLWSTRLLAVTALLAQSKADLDAAQRVLKARLDQVRKAERLIESELARVNPSRQGFDGGAFGQPAVSSTPTPPVQVVLRRVR